MGTFDCSKCGSDQTAKCSTIYASGTTGIETKTTGMGVGLSRGGFVPVVGGGTTRGVQQTELAAQLAPPANKSAKEIFKGCASFFGVIGVIGCVIFMPLGMMILVGGVAVAGITALIATLCFRPYNRDEWPKLYEQWERKWYCGRCGETFTPDPNAEPVALSTPATQVTSAATIPERGLPEVPVAAADEAPHMATPDGPSIAVEELPDTPEELVAVIAGNMGTLDLTETVPGEHNRQIRTCGAALARLELMVVERPELRSTAMRLRAEYVMKMAAVKKTERIGKVAGIASMLVLFGIVMAVIAKGC